MRDRKFWRLIGPALVALLGVSCIDKLPTNTGSALLYVFDGSSHAVLAWTDVAAIYDATSAEAASRTITSSAKIGSTFTLGLGGMALDGSRQNLYLVAATGGKVVQISRIGSQAGELSSADVLAFTIDDTGTDAAAGGGSPVFGQAAVDTSSNTLFVTESNGINSQIWAIPLGAIADGSTVASTGSNIIGNTKLTSGTHDTGCTGVASNGSGVTYAFFHGGDTLNQGGTTSNPPFAAPDRIRKGVASGFDRWDNVILGQSGSAITLLAQFGNLAYDTSSDTLYAACQNGTATPLLAFGSGQFSASGPAEAAPVFAFGGPSDLRVIAHASQKDWVVGASPAGSSLWIWKGPSTGVDAHVSVPLSGVQIYGLALDGRN